MAESLTKQEIEQGIKKLINIRSSNTQITEKGTDDSLKNPSADRPNTSKNPGNPDLQKDHDISDQSKTSTKKKKNKKKKKPGENKELGEDVDNPPHSERWKRKKARQLQSRKSETPDTKQDESVKISQERDILKPGLIISVNEHSKRQISTYLKEKPAVSTPALKDGERKSEHADRVTVDSKGNIVEEDRKYGEDSPKKMKKRRKKGKKSTTDSSCDEDEDRKGQSLEGHKPDHNIDEAVKKFWSMKTGQGQKTKGVKTHVKKERSGNVADDEKGPNEDQDFHLDLSDLDDDISVDILLKILERDRIYPLRKKPARFPRARFFCRVCDYHMDTVDDVRRHGKDHRHQRRVDNIKIQDELKRMTPPTDDQIKAMDSLLEEIYQQQCLTKAVLKERNTVVENLEIFLKKIIPDTDMKLKIFGSSLSGLGLISSDVNVDLEVQKDHAKYLTMAFKGMKESDDYESVISDFTSKVPCIYFTMNNVQYRITISSEPARNTSQLLKLYGVCDHRFIQLAVVFKYWAKICKVDRQDEGTLPAYSYCLLLIFYLQRCTPPVLPVLYQGSDDCKNVSPTKNRQILKSEEVVDFNEITEMAEHWKSENTESLGSLWLGLFRYYVLGFEINTYVVCIRQLAFCTRAQKKWNSKKLAIEDPFSPKRNVSKSVVGFELFEYIWDCVRKSYRYFGQPTNCKTLNQKQKKKHSQKKNTTNQSKKPEEKTSDKLCQDLKSVTVSSTQNDETGKGSVAGNGTSRETLTGTTSHSEPETDMKKIEGENVENNDKEKRHNNVQDLKIQNKDGQACSNVVRHGSKTETICIPRHVWSIATMSSFTMTTNTPELSSHRLRKSSETCTSDSYIAISSDSCHDIFTNISSDLKNDGEQSDIHDSIQTPEPLRISTSSQNVIYFAKCIVDSVLAEAIALTATNMISSDETVDNSVIQVDTDIQHEIVDASSEESEVLEDTTPRYNYLFLYSHLTDGKGPAVYCPLCEKEGHLKHSCPEELLPELVPIPKMTKSHKEMLSSLLKRIPREYGPSDAELREREMVRRELEEFIRELYPDAALHLFGSSHNGFGFRNSDLDLCVTFDEHPTGENLDLVNCIENICSKLKTHRGLYNVFPITTAKVPIVKFRHRRSQLEGDISMYNLLALQNTEMVQMYAAMDQRVRILGYALKVFVKVCDIGDASRGSLSSYAYVLMLLHYLQQCKPPVIPVLQELYHHYGPVKPELKIDGWNAWYFDNIKALPDVWLEYGQNKQTVGELWLGLFRYYTEEFNMKEQVVCSRQTQVLTKFEKLWNSPCIAIEDPFDLNHNLGGGLSRKMQQYIHKAFIKGRELYGNPRPDLQMDWKVLCGYYFDTERLMEGPPPNDRCCRVCNKIGHIAKECPVVKNRKEREEKDRKRKADQKTREDEKKKHQQHQRDNENYGNERSGSGNYSSDRSRSGNFSNERGGNPGSSRDQGSYKERVIHRTISESHDHQYYQSQPMPVPESPGSPQTHRSMSLPSGHQGHGHYSPMSSPQGYHGFPQNLSPLQHNILPQQYRPSTYSDNSGVNRSLFNSQSQQFRSSPGRSTSSGGHQVPVSACHQSYYILAPPQQQLSGGIAEGFLLPISTYNPLYPNMSIPVGLGTTHKPISSPPSSDLVTGDQFCMAAESVGTDRERQQRPNNSNSQQNRGNNSYTESPQRNGQNPRMQNSMFRQAEQYYNQGQKH